MKAPILSVKVCLGATLGALVYQLITSLVAFGTTDAGATAYFMLSSGLAFGVVFAVVHFRSNVSLFSCFLSGLVYIGAIGIVILAKIGFHPIAVFLEADVLPAVGLVCGAWLVGVIATGSTVPEWQRKNGGKR